MDDDEPAKPAAVSRQAAARREAELQRTAKWRDKGNVWPPPPVRQEAPRPVKPPPDLLEQVLVCACQFIGGLVLSYFAVAVSYLLMSPFVPEHVYHSKPPASEMPTELLKTAFAFVIVIAVAAVFLRASKVVALSVATGGVLYLAFSLAFLGM